MSQKQDLTTLMKRLREYLPGNVQRFEADNFRSPDYYPGINYVVDNKVLISLNYYCRWGKDIEEQTKKCHPVSVNVRPYITGIEERQGTSPERSKVFRTRTLQRKADGDFNLESIAAAVTKCVLAVDTWEEEYATRKEAKEKERALITDTHKMLRKELGFEKCGYNTGRVIIDSVEIQCSPVVVDVVEESTVRFSLDFDGLDLSQVKLLISTLKEGLKGAN